MMLARSNLITAFRQWEQLPEGWEITQTISGTKWEGSVIWLFSGQSLSTGGVHDSAGYHSQPILQCLSTLLPVVAYSY